MDITNIFLRFNTLQISWHQQLHLLFQFILYPPSHATITPPSANTDATTALIDHEIHYQNTRSIYKYSVMKHGKTTSRVVCVCVGGTDYNPHVYPQVDATSTPHPPQDSCPRFVALAKPSIRGSRRLVLRNYLICRPACMSVCTYTRSGAFVREVICDLE